MFQTHWHKPLYYYVDSDFLPNYGTSYDPQQTVGDWLLCSYLAGACASHCSRRQTAIATSTAHAEYLAALECGREAIRIRVLLKDMGLPSWELRRFLKTTKHAFGCRKPNHQHRVLSTSMCGVTGCKRLWPTTNHYVLSTVQRQKWWRMY
jgi:hypothetical protein